MATLSAVCNTLGDVYEAAKLVDAKPEALNALAELLVSHGLNDSYDIRLNHKHFDIAEDEQVVGFGGQDMLVSAVCNDGRLPLDVLQETNIRPLPNGIMTPSDYFVNDDGEATPYEFAYSVSSDDAAGPLDKGFLAEWSSVLRNHDLAGLLGLSVQEKDVPVDAHEVSDPVARANKLYYGEAAADGMLVVSTTWRVEETGGIIQAKKCRYCSQISRHGRHC